MAPTPTLDEGVATPDVTEAELAEMMATLPFFTFDDCPHENTEQVDGYPYGHAGIVDVILVCHDCGREVVVGRTTVL